MKIIDGKPEYSGSLVSTSCSTQYVTGSEKTTLIVQLCKKIFLRGTENLTIILPIAVCFRRIAYSVAEL